MPEAHDDVPLPPHAYVPGSNARHPEDWFDALKSTVQPDMPPAFLHHTKAWRAGIVYFNAGFFWECHEVLEAVWMQTPNPSAEREMVQAIIQLANARLKLRMNRPRASRRLCVKVRAHLAGIEDERVVLGWTADDVLRLVKETETALS